MNSEDTLILNDPDLGSATVTIGGTGGFFDSASASSAVYSYTTASNYYGNVVISNGSSGMNWGNITTTGQQSQPSIHVTGNAEFEGDLKVKGVSIVKTLDEINRRLAILVPDPDKLENFEALKKAYDHYKTLEALCQLPTKE